MRKHVDSMEQLTISRRELHAAHLQYTETIQDNRIPSKEPQFLVFLAIGQQEDETLYRCCYRQLWKFIEGNIKNEAK